MKFIRPILWLAMSLMAVAIAFYAVNLLLAPSGAPSFLKERLDAGSLILYAHFIGGGFALIAGSLQMNTSLRKKFPMFHRNLGRLYLTSVLISGLAGLQMATVGIGGLAAQLGFGFLAVGWLTTGSMAYISIRKGNVHEHRNWMMRNYALTLAAVTLRIYLGVTLAALKMDFVIVYPFIAWGCWVPNLLLAEWLFVKSKTVAMSPD